MNICEKTDLTLHWNCGENSDSMLRTLPNPFYKTGAAELGNEGCDLMFLYNPGMERLENINLLSAIYEKYFLTMSEL